MLYMSSTEYVVHEPVRPDNDEDVESDDEAQEAEDNVASAEVDERADDLDHVVDQADDRQHNPRHHQTGFSLKKMKINQKVNHPFVQQSPSWHRGREVRQRQRSRCRGSEGSPSWLLSLG